MCIFLHPIQQGFDLVLPGNLRLGSFPNQILTNFKSNLDQIIHIQIKATAVKSNLQM